jgi:hypothetical protein
MFLPKEICLKKKKHFQAHHKRDKSNRGKGEKEEDKTPRRRTRRKDKVTAGP